MNPYQSPAYETGGAKSSGDRRQRLQIAAAWLTLVVLGAPLPVFIAYRAALILPMLAALTIIVVLTCLASKRKSLHIPLTVLALVLICYVTAMLFDTVPRDKTPLWEINWRELLPGPRR